MPAHPFLRHNRSLNSVAKTRFSQETHSLQSWAAARKAYVKNCCTNASKNNKSSRRSPPFKTRWPRISRHTRLPTRNKRLASFLPRTIVSCKYLYKLSRSINERLRRNGSGKKKIYLSMKGSIKIWRWNQKIWGNWLASLDRNIGRRFKRLKTAKKNIVKNDRNYSNRVRSLSERLVCTKKFYSRVLWASKTCRI